MKFCRILTTFKQAHGKNIIMILSLVIGYVTTNHYMVEMCIHKQSPTYSGAIFAHYKRLLRKNNLQLISKYLGVY